MQANDFQIRGLRLPSYLRPARRRDIVRARCAREGRNLDAGIAALPCRFERLSKLPIEERFVTDCEVHEEYILHRRAGVPGRLNPRGPSTTFKNHQTVDRIGNGSEDPST